MFLGWVAQGQVCSKKPPASREVLSPGFGMRWDNLWLKPRWILWNLMVKSWFPVDFPLNQSVEAYTSFCARNLMSNSSNVASWWVSLMILQLHYDPYMPCYPGIAVDVDLAKREMWTATHMVALWSWDILDITYIYIWLYMYISHCHKGRWQSPAGRVPSGPALSLGPLLSSSNRAESPIWREEGRGRGNEQSHSVSY